MDDFFFVLMIIFFVVAPVLEKVLKGGRKPTPPQQQRRNTPAQRRRLPDGRTTTVSMPRGETGADAPARDASELLPAELWEILTGSRSGQAQRRQPEPVSEPEPVEWRAEPEPERPAADRRSAAVTRARPALDEERAAAELMRRRERSQTERRRYDYSQAGTVSLEAEPAAEEARHRAFHRKLEHLPPAARRVRTMAPDLALDNTAALRHAVLLQEVLGRPKGLD